MLLECHGRGHQVVKCEKVMSGIFMSERLPQNNTRARVDDGTSQIGAKAVPFFTDDVTSQLVGTTIMHKAYYH